MGKTRELIEQIKKLPSGILSDYGFAMGDEESDLTAQVTPLYTDIITRSQTIDEMVFKIPFEAPAGGLTTFDFKVNGTSVFSTLPTIDDGEFSTITATTPAVLTTTILTRGDKIEAFLTIVAATTTGKGLKCAVLGQLI